MGEQELTTALTRILIARRERDRALERARVAEEALERCQQERDELRAFIEHADDGTYYTLRSERDDLHRSLQALREGVREAEGEISNFLRAWIPDGRTRNEVKGLGEARRRLRSLLDTAPEEEG